VKEMLGAFEEKFPEIKGKISLSALYHRVKKLKFTFKKITSVKRAGNQPSNKEKRKEYCVNFLDLFNSHLKIIFLDECGFNLGGKENYGWAPRNKRAIEQISPKSQNYSVLAFLCLEGLLGFSVTRGSLDSQTFSGLTNEFFRNHNPQFDQNSTIFVLDNAKIHHSNLSKILVLECMHHLFLPAYSPQLNPIEYCFNKLKKFVFNERPANEPQLIHCLQRAAKQITFMDTLGYYKKVMKQMGEAYRFQDLI
jgi:transposase